MLDGAITQMRTDVSELQKARDTIENVRMARDFYSCVSLHVHSNPTYIAPAKS